MAETWTQSFGRYLKSLRERRGLSLEEVRSLSQAFADTLNKGYLSRCENGHQRIAFSKVIPLSRIYDVPADALLERLELDMELDRVGAPSTEGMEFSALSKAGMDAFNRGYRWKAYGFFRDAVSRATVDPLRPSFRDLAEQAANASMNCATAALTLGRIRFAQSELLFIKGHGGMSPRFLPVLLRQLSRAYRELGELKVARDYADRAVATAETDGAPEYLGYAYSNRASQALAEGDLKLASALLQKSYKTFRDTDHPNECAQMLNNLAQVYFDLGRHRAARKAASAAIRATKSHRIHALCFMLEGELEASEKNESNAEKRWREAARIAKQLDDKVLRFKAEYLLFEQACRTGQDSVARALHRRLAKLSNYIPKTTPELRDFEELASTQRMVS